MRLLHRQRVAGDQHVEVRADAVQRQQAVREARLLVGDDRQLDAAGFEQLEQRRHARVQVARLAARRAVLEREAVPLRVGGWLAERLVEQRARPVADPLAYARGVDAPLAERAQGAIERQRDVGRGVDQRAVEIEQQRTQRAFCALRHLACGSDGVRHSATSAHWRRSIMRQMNGVKISCIASSILPPGTTIVLARDMNESWTIDSRYGKSMPFGLAKRITHKLSEAAGMSRAMNGLEVSTTGTRWKLTCVCVNCGQM